MVGRLEDTLAKESTFTVNPSIRFRSERPCLSSAGKFLDPADERPRSDDVSSAEEVSPSGVNASSGGLGGIKLPGKKLSGGAENFIMSGLNPLFITLS